MMKISLIKKMNFAPKRPVAFKILENNLGCFYFENTEFYLSMSTGWDATKNQSEGATELWKFLHRNIRSNSFFRWCKQSSKFRSAFTLIFFNFTVSRHK